MRISLSDKEISDARQGRILKCGFDSHEQMKFEFGFRLRNNIPMGLSFVEARGYKNE